MTALIVFRLYFKWILWYNIPKECTQGGYIMNKIFSFVLCCAVVSPAVALTPAGQSRRSVQAQMVESAPRATASKNQLAAMATSTSVSSVASADVSKSSVRVEPAPVAAPVVDKREKEKNACINNNIGIGNTFVWASRYSNLNNYASMVEDVEEPKNNTCFVRVELKSSDSKISVADVPAKYFEMGRTITCGEWADEGTIKKRILDAKKSARTWATVGGAVGGAAVGVGIMELFGNKLIGGSVEGQKSLSQNEQLRSQLLVLKKDKAAEYEEFGRQLKALRTECDKDIWNGTEKPEECQKFDYEGLLQIWES